MKNILIILIVVSSINCQAQKFNGYWTKQINNIEHSFDYIHITDKTTNWPIIDNQLGLICKNIYKNDTLYLKVISTDQGRGFMGPKYYPPKSGSFIAKLYIYNNKLQIIYIENIFKENIKLFELPTTMYKN